MQTQHAVAWLDHREAKVFFFNREAAESVRLATTLAHHQTHNKAGTVDGKRARKTRPSITMSSTPCGQRRNGLTRGQDRQRTNWPSISATTIPT